jgi:hypothetical protein
MGGEANGEKGLAPVPARCRNDEARRGKIHQAIRLSFRR